MGRAKRWLVEPLSLVFIFTYHPLIECLPA